MTFHSVGNRTFFLCCCCFPPGIFVCTKIERGFMRFSGSTPKQQPIDRHVNFFCWEKSRPVKKLICSESGYGFHSINFIETYFSTTVPQVLSKCLLRNFFYMFRRPAVDGTWAAHPVIQRQQVAKSRATFCLNAHSCKCASKVLRCRQSFRRIHRLIKPHIPSTLLVCTPVCGSTKLTL